LNDPLDCQVDIRKAAENAISRLSGKKRQNLISLSKHKGILDDIQKSLRDVGVCSFSLVLEHPLLWSHYADGHKGLCLAYEIPFSAFFGPERTIDGAILPVHYDENPLTEWFMNNTPEKAKIDTKEFSNALVERVLSIKAKEWEYEKEARIICRNEGAVPIQHHHLKQVCFGMNTAKADLSLVKQLVDNTGYSVEYFRIERTENDFGIKTVKM
jgi:hypothetical protein